MTATTVNGNGGLNVIDVNGNIGASLILNGTANDEFIINVTGSVGNSTLGLAGGVTADHVLYKFMGASGSIATHVGNVLNGTLLAQTYNFTLDGTFNGEIIGGGKSITLLSQAHVNAVPFAPPAQQQPVSISGFVFNSGNGLGIGGVTVEVEDSSGNMLATTVTNPDGSYSFGGLQPGTYLLAAVPTGNLIGIGEQVGTVNGSTDRTDLGSLTLGNINLANGNAGINFDFFLGGGAALQLQPWWIAERRAPPGQIGRKRIA